MKSWNIDIIWKWQEAAAKPHKASELRSSCKNEPFHMHLGNNLFKKVPFKFNVRSSFAATRQKSETSSAVSA